MKVVVIFACLLVLVAADSDNVFQQYIEFMSSTIEMCADKLGVGKEIVEKVKTPRKSTEVDTVGCMLACMLKNYDIIQNCKINVSAVHCVIDTVSADQPEVATKLKHITAKCANTVKDMTNECELALQYANCGITDLEDI